MYLRVRRLCRRAFPEAEETEVVYYTIQALRGDRHYVSASTQTTIDGLQQVLKFADLDDKTDGSKQIQRTKTSKTDVNRSGAQRSAETTFSPTNRFYDFSKMECANCGNLGHSYRRCAKPQDKAKIDQYLAQQLDKTTTYANRQAYWIENPEVDRDVILDIEIDGAGCHSLLEEDARPGIFHIEEDSTEEHLSVSVVAIAPTNAATPRTKYLNPTNPSSPYRVSNIFHKDDEYDMKSIEISPPKFSKLKTKATKRYKRIKQHQSYNRKLSDRQVMRTRMRDIKTIDINGLRNAENAGSTDINNNKFAITRSQHLVHGGLLGTKHNEPPPSQIPVNTNSIDQCDRVVKAKRVGYG